jgi:RND family efflux transporter MFP subunit
MKTMTRKSFALIALLAQTAAYSGAAFSADDKKAGPAKAALTVTVAAPQQASLPVKLSANGNIAAWQEALIGSEVSGLRLVELRAAVGDHVKRGEVLAVFDGESVKADLMQARASLMEAAANDADAGANAARARNVQESGALSAQQVSQYVTAAQIAAARKESAIANLANVQLRMNHTQVIAPDDGVISARSATVGAVSGVGVELFRLIRQGRLEWRAEVTSTELSSIRRGMSVNVSPANGSQVTGKVRMVAPTVDPQTRAALVYVDLLPGSDKLAPPKAGMFAKGEFELGQSKALTVPQQSVVLRDGFTYVFRMNTDGRVAQQKVRTGRRVGEQVEVIEGLAANAQVVVSGAGFLNDGDLVKIVTAASSNTAAAAATK